MNMERIREIANAVLYEGYLLYPYRHSAIKNRQRWTFGVVYPRAYSEAQGCQGGADSWTMRTECLVTGREESSLGITVRFLHLLTRTALRSGGGSAGLHADTPAVANGHVSNWTPDSWEEAVEREVALPDLTLHALVAAPVRMEIAFPSAHLDERMRVYGAAAGVIVREQQPVAGAVVVAAEPIGPTRADLFKVSVRIENTTPIHAAELLRHDAVLPWSFVSTHTIVRVRQGAFVSLLDPPDELGEAASACQNLRTWPVLVGDEGERDALLSSPIILYDYPRIAPESAGALFDGTEIDEILTLRILTLTDEEKEEMRQGDTRAREILERTEAISAE